MSELDSYSPKKRRKGQRMTNKQRAEAQVLFLAAYEHTANVISAADLVGIDRRLVYYWQEHDEEFLFAYHIADKAANARIEAEIRRRAMEGLEKPLVSMGQLVYEGKGKDRRKVVIREYSDTLLMFYAKRRMPEYRDKQQVDVTTHTGAKDMQQVHDAIAYALASYPEAKVAVASALVEIEKTRTSGK